MAANNASIGGRPASGRRGKRAYPVKRTINLAMTDVQPMNPGLAIPLVILVLIAAVLFGKFAVVDRLKAVSQAEAEVAEAKSRLSEAYQRLDSYGELSELYAHYTFSGMTDEEVHRTDRAEVLDLIREVIYPRVRMDNWSLRGNILTVTMTADTLEDINQTAQTIKAEDIVDLCTVTNAKTNEIRHVIKNEEDDTEETIIETSVTAQALVYLNPDEGVDRR
ncbi:MAG: hypothetical protein K6C12_14025 [Oscillospiraceae bacterium]|nr:hypothetical protein [Oscillospiraceae bacterium]